MNTKSKKFSLLTALLAGTLLIYSGCGSDSTTSPGGSGSYPTITMKSGSSYQYTNDSLNQSGGSFRTSIISKDSILPQITLAGKSCFPVRDVAYDTAHPLPIQIGVDTIYLAYDAGAGKFYQYGIVKLIDSTSTPTWDLVADFSVAAGVSWTIVANKPVTIHGFNLTTTLTAKVAENTSFQTTGNPSSAVSCYRIEINAALFASGLQIGVVYFDYYIGYASSAANPSGIVRLKLRPVNLSGYFLQSGFDRILETFTIAP